MSKYQELCDPFIKQSRKCSKNMFNKLEPKLKQIGFFAKLPMTMENYADLKEVMNSSPEFYTSLESVARSLGVDLNGCMAPSIDLNGKLLTPVSSQGEFLQVNNWGKGLHCDMLSSIEYGNSYVNPNYHNAFIEVLNRNGFDVDFLGYPSYSEEEIEALFGL